MSSKYPGGIISKTAPTPSGPYSTDTAPGVWTLEQQAYWQKLGQWPTAGNVNPNAFIENLFSTYLYTGNGSTQTITNGIDLSTNGGMVWIKCRTPTATNNWLSDTVRGNTKRSSSNTTSAESTLSTSITSFNSNGFSIGSNSNVNGNGANETYVSWTFREQPKFFDIVTYTGDGTSSRNITHNLGSVPGCIIIKATSAVANWYVYHRSTGNQGVTLLNTTNAVFTGQTDAWNSTTPTASVFSIGNAVAVNDTGITFVAYLFAHDAGGFGLSGTDNVISCGSYAGSSTVDVDVNLGYEPQFVMIKNITTGSTDWYIADIMRGMALTGIQPLLSPNLTDVETGFSGTYFTPTATGMKVQYGSGTAICSAGNTYIYIAIRRGPMAVPTLGTSVFSPLALSNTTGTKNTTGFPVDLQINAERNGVHNTFVVDRLRGVITNDTDTASPYLKTNATSAEATDITALTRYWDNTGFMTASYLNSAGTAYWNFRRAPSFFDEVCYTGTGVDLTVNHNLGVVPEWVIIKNRSRAGTNWSGAYFANASEYYDLRINQDIGRSLNTMGPLGPTLISNSATTFGVLGGSTLVNYSGDTYVAYLFATCAGVSKVGTYTGTGTTQTINCGFTAGSRFVLIKRTDSTGDWYVWDSARGIVAGNDPYLLLNTTAAEVTGTDYVDTYNAGFEISSTAPAGINANGGTFIFLAIA